MNKLIKDIPGQWITVLVGSAVLIYLLGNTKTYPTLTQFSDDTVGVGIQKLPGGLLGTLGILATAGGFLNRESFGKLT